LHNEKDGDTCVAQWKKPYEAAILELDPTKLQQRISEAHQAILNRIEELLTRPSDSEQHALNDALRNLRILRKMSEAGTDGHTKMQV
jgi:multidrug efflux pump subunit AcrA (membrane-fusion protein)